MTEYCLSDHRDIHCEYPSVYKIDNEEDTEYVCGLHVIPRVNSMLNGGETYVKIIKVIEFIGGQL